MPEINWYPGHMAKTRRILVDQVKSVDAVIELCDARAPGATRNPDLVQIAKGKNHFLVLNKCDLANDIVTRKWIAHFEAQGISCVRFQSTGGKAKDVLNLIQKAAQPAVDRMKARGANKTVRMMVVGIPNVGKSTFINKLRGQAIAKASDRPGVTRSNQWVKVGPFLELLDTPGMLWPKLENQKNAEILAYLGSIRDQIMDSEELAGNLIKLLMNIAPNETMARFRVQEDAKDKTVQEILEDACRGRGWLLSGARCDTERAAALILDEFRGNKVGKISLEVPEGR